MNRALTMLMGATPWLTGCAVHIRSTATSRVEQARTASAAAGTNVRLASVTTFTLGRDRTAALELAPQVMSGAVTGTRLRAAAHWAGADAWHPTLDASVEQGLTRTAELVTDSSGRLPAAPVVQLRQARGSAGVRVEYDRRLRFNARIAVARSEGRGADTSALPVLASAAAEFGGEWQAHRRARLGAILRLADERVGSAAPVTTSQLAAFARVVPRAPLDLTAAAGLTRTAHEVKPSVELRLAYAPPSLHARVGATIARAAEVDRLSGALTERTRTAVQLESRLVPRVSFRGTLQNSALLGANTQSVVRNADARLTLELGRQQRLELGVARFQQYQDGVRTNADVRTFVQFSIAPVH